MPATPCRADAGFDPEAVAALRAAIEAGEVAPLPALVPESLAHGPPKSGAKPKPAPKRKPARRQRKAAPKRTSAPKPVTRNHGVGHPRASPEATALVLARMDAGESAKDAAAAAGVNWVTAKRIWIREGRTWPPPGYRKGLGKGGGKPATVTPAQAREAIKLRGERTPGGGWERSIPSIAAELGVSVKALRRAIEKEEKRSEEER